MPSHDGSIRRVCVHANCHGIARRLSTPFPGARRAGRLPMLTCVSSGSGVAVRKYGMNRGSSYTTDRYVARARAAT